MINVPTPLREPTDMADWIALRALTAADHSAGAADLLRVIVTAGEAHTSRGARSDDELLSLHPSMNEIQDRATSTGHP